MNRARSREVVMEIMYQMEIHKTYEMDDMQKFLEHYEEVLDMPYIHRLVELWLNNRAEVEGKIVEHLKGWKLDRIAKIDLAILRLGITELVYADEIPIKVSINEAVNLAKKYVDDKSGKFVNGVLSHFAEEE